MARARSPWDKTEMPNGTVILDPAWSDDRFDGRPEGRWMGTGFARQSNRAAGVFVAVLIAYVVILWPYVAFGLFAFIGVGLLLAIGAAWLLFRQGTMALLDHVGAAWFYFPEPPPSKQAAEEGLSAIVAGAGFTKVRFDKNEMDPGPIRSGTDALFPAPPPTPAHQSTWYGDDVLLLRLYNTSGTRLHNNPTGEDRPFKLYIETRGEGKQELHQKLKGQVAAAFARPQEMEEFTPLKAAREVAE